MSLLDIASLLVTPNAYKATKLYSIIPSNGNGDFTVTRATTATRVNSSGLIESVALNVPRVDYSLGSCPNILLEPLRTNLCLWSEEFNNAVWAVTGISIDANVTTAPNGVLTAEKIKVNSGQAVGSSHIQQIITKAASALAYSCSAYLKASELNSARLFVRDGISALNNANAQFNLSTGVISIAATANGTFSSASATITNVGNGWYRCTLSFTSSTDTTLQLRIGTADTTITTGNGIDGIFGWGAQLELGTSGGSFATSYIPTISATTTRNLETFTRNNIYTNGLISASGGTLFVELRNNIGLPRQSGFPTIWLSTSASGSAGNVIGIGSSTGFARAFLYYYDNGGTLINLGTTTTNTIKVAFVWTPTTLKTFVNGSLFSSTTGISWTITNLQNLTVRGEVLIFLNEMALFPTPLTDPQCIALTT